jgi:hypothetical protein
MEAGLRTNTTACTLSIAVKISRTHSVVGGMASQSTIYPTVASGGREGLMQLANKLFVPARIRDEDLLHSCQAPNKNPEEGPPGVGWVRSYAISTQSFRVETPYDSFSKLP